ncbi:MAG TPA: VWA domain-containing protein [Pyrinomonadaceae bacterium]|nr:VWA domain-containing protein [Pyrinomonadaceae bacterium]
MLSRIIVGLLVCQLTLSVFAQQPGSQQQKPEPQPSPQQTVPADDDNDVVKITTNLVQVDPVITDKDGKVVTDLSADEVEILEDGKPQKITHFSFVSLDPGPRPAPKQPTDKNALPVPSVRLRPEDVRRTIAIVVDDLGTSFSDIYVARQAIKKFLDQQMQPGDLVAIVRTGGGMGALQQFTSDKRQLYAALERVKFNPRNRTVGLFDSPGSNPLAIAGQATTEANDPDRGRSDDLDEMREDLFTVGTLGAVNYVIRGLRELPGRKSVVLISGGFALTRINDAGRNYRVEDAKDRLIDLANRASVVIYAIDAAGLETLNLTAADGPVPIGEVGGHLSDLRGKSFNKQGGLKELAEATGGFAIVNNNDLSGGIRRALDDQNSYYLIGYRPDESTFQPVRGGRPFHKITVRVKRPGKFTVRLRKGFFGLPEETRNQVASTPGQLLMHALMSPFGSSGVNVRLTALFLSDPKLGATMRALLHIKTSDLTFTEEAGGWHQAVINLVTVTFGDNGIVVDSQSNTHTLRLKNTAYENAIKHGVTYSFLVPIKKPGAYQLRTAIRDDASNRVGSASQFVEVPDLNKKRLTLSGIVSHGIKTKQYQPAAVDSLNPNGAAEGDDDPLSNAAARQFQRDMVVEYGFAIYNAKLDKTSGKPQLVLQVRLFREGKAVFVGDEIPFDAANQADLKRLTTNGAIQLGSQMEPGDYVLQVVVTDLLRNDKSRIATQWIDFEIVN